MDETGVVVLFMAGPTVAEEQPYQAIWADIHRCPGCGHSLVTHFADRPVARDEAAGEYAEEHRALGKTVIVVHEHLPLIEEDVDV